MEIVENKGILLVSLNKSFNQTKAEGVYKRPNLYEATRKYWSIGRNRPDSINYVLGVYKGIVQSVVKVSSYRWVEKAEDGTIFKKPRCSFEGELIEDSPYLNMYVSQYPFGSGSAFRYIDS